MPHFEIYAADTKAARVFYSGLFGWNFTPMPGAEEVDYNLVESETIGMGKGLTAGLMRRSDATPATGSPIRGGTLTIEVANCDERYEWALANGGSEALPPETYPGIGRSACVEDGHGNVVCMIQPEKEA